MTPTTWHTQMFYPTQWIAQSTSIRYVLQLTDDAGNPLTLTQVTTVTLSIFDLEVQPPVLLIGPRDVKNVPANGGALATTGLLTLTLSGADTALLNEMRTYERRRWQIIWTHASGAKTQIHEVDRIVANIAEAV